MDGKQSIIIGRSADWDYKTIKGGLMKNRLRIFNLQDNKC